MKAIMILGGVVGFVVGAGFGLAANSTWPTALWRAGAAALVAAILARWWSRIWLKSLRESLDQHRQARSQPALPAKPATK